jgi:hypothetical protein
MPKNHPGNPGQKVRRGKQETHLAGGSEKEDELNQGTDSTKETEPTLVHSSTLVIHIDREITLHQPCAQHVAEGVS